MSPELLADVLARLGKSLQDRSNVRLEQAIRRAYLENHWFDEENIRFALEGWSQLLTPENLLEWLNREQISPLAGPPKKVGIIMAGNIPLVGLHDLLCVLLSGHQAIVKLSQGDQALMGYIISEIQRMSDEAGQRIEIAERLKGLDAVIATGSNNSSRYFEAYFGHLPHIIRKNRNSVAVLHGEETEEQLCRLGADIFRYYGLGCRNITHLYAPQNYDITRFYDAIAPWYEVLNHNKYANNYTYHKALFLMNRQEHLDNNFLLLRLTEDIYSPIGTLGYSFYNSKELLYRELTEKQDQIQVIASENELPAYHVKFGETQRPGLMDYADHINTLHFLKGL